MTTPLVTELCLPLEPVSPDPFIEGLAESDTPSGGRHEQNEQNATNARFQHQRAEALTGPRRGT
jgi:hypothetical protein